MAEKRVSVRLGAQGGRAVKAELEGVGEAGTRGFGRLSAEAQKANAALAAFAGKAKLAAAGAAAALTAAAGAAIRSGLAQVDAQAKLAQSLGTTVESVQTLARAGDLAGVSQGQLEAAVRALTVRLSQAATGAGPAAKALQALGLRATELAALPLDQRLERINAALDATAGPTQRAALAAQLFGEEAGLAFGRIDTATLRQAAADVRDFGVAVSEADADQIELTNDAISRLGIIWTGVSNQLAAAAAPGLQAVADALAALARDVLPAATAALQSAGESLSTLGALAAGLAATRIPALLASVTALSGGLNLAATAAAAARAALALLGGPLGIALGLTTAAVIAFRDLRDRADGLDDSLALVRETQEKLNGAVSDFATTAAPDAAAEAVRYANELRKQAAAARDAAASELALARARIERASDPLTFGRPGVAEGIISAREEALARAEQALAEAEAAASRAVRTVTGATSERMSAAAGEALKLEVSVDGVTKALAKAGETGAGSLRAVRDALAGASAATVDLGDTTARAAADAATGWAAVAESVRGYTDRTGEWGAELGDAIGDGFRSAEAALQQFVETGKLDFKSLVSSILSDLARLTVQQGVTGPLSGFLGNLFNRAVVGGFFGGPDLTADPTPGLFGRALGGPVRAGQAYLVGERGPELFAPGASGRVYSTRDTAAMLRGGGGGGAQQIVLRLDLSSDLDARIVSAAQGVAVETVRSGLASYDRALPARFAAISRDPRAR